MWRRDDNICFILRKNECGGKETEKVKDVVIIGKPKSNTRYMMEYNRWMERTEEIRYAYNACNIYKKCKNRFT